MEIQIIKGEKQHIPSILNLIKELAVYEKEPDAVLVTEKDLEKDCFGEKQYFDFYVALSNGEVVGCAIYYNRYSTWEGRTIYLEDLIVTDSHRGKGIGSLLFDKLISVCKEEKVRRFEWQVLDWNESAINFYKKYNAELDSGWVNGRISF